jgi:hypothetical protein
VHVYQVIYIKLAALCAVWYDIETFLENPTLFQHVSVAATTTIIRIDFL